MAILKLYRIDQRTLAAGDPVQPPGDHIEQLTDKQQTAETILRRAAGDRERVRADFIFAFDNLDWARKYFVLKKDRTLYELAVDEKHILHSADMELFNKIAALNADTDEARAFAAQYWQGELGDGKCVEHICTEAKVTDILYTPAQRNALFNELYRKDKPSSDNNRAFYQSVFNRPKK
jgi:hypothetical protein